jgi:hypothetical protein
MKRLIIATSILALVVTAGFLATRANAETKRQEKATIEFTETVKLMGALLKGEYLIVHDEDRMSQGDACIYLYDSSGKLVVSFHCTPVERAKAKSFRVVARQNQPYGPKEITEIQFAGSTEAHQVPSF